MRTRVNGHRKNLLNYRYTLFEIENEYYVADFGSIPFHWFFGVYNRRFLFRYKLAKISKEYGDELLILKGDRSKNKPFNYALPAGFGYFFLNFFNSLDNKISAIFPIVTVVATYVFLPFLYYYFKKSSSYSKLDYTYKISFGIKDEFRGNTDLKYRLLDLFMTCFATHGHLMLLYRAINLGEIELGDYIILIFSIFILLLLGSFPYSEIINDIYIEKIK